MSTQTPGLADFHQREVGRCDSSGAKSLSPQQQRVVFSCWFVVWKQNIAKSHLLVRGTSCEKHIQWLVFPPVNSGFSVLGRSFLDAKKSCKNMGTEASRVLGFRAWIHVLHLLGTSLQAGQFNRTVGKVGENMSKTLQLEGDFLWVGSCLFFLVFLFSLELCWILHLLSQVEIGRNMVGSLLIARLKTTWPAVCACCDHHRSSAITMLWCQGYHRREDRGRLPVLLPRWWSRLGEL